jgi:hypothetical protein
LIFALPAAPLVLHLLVGLFVGVAAYLNWRANARTTLTGATAWRPIPPAPAVCASAPSSR